MGRSTGPHSYSEVWYDDIIRTPSRSLKQVGMFWTKKVPAPAVVSKAPAPAPSLKRPARTSAPSIISSDLVVNGTLTSTGELHIEGQVEGDIRSAALVIGEMALIHGEVVAEDVTVRGRV